MNRVKKEIIAMFQDGMDVFLEDGRDGARRKSVVDRE